MKNRLFVTAAALLAAGSIYLVADAHFARTFENDA
jgi:hypothetical protein